MNTTIIAGNIGRSAEMKYLQSGTCVANFSVAVNKTWKQDGEKREKTTWFKCTIWGKYAETMTQYLTQGTAVCVRGEIDIDKPYINKNGDPAASLSLRVDEIKLMGRGSGGGNSQPADDGLDGQGGDFVPPPSNSDDIPF